ncbi:MAG: hypothetical protein JW889_04460 [Verrucomicrobia bacterium]|nr:hypothetical protein [Verrucomicrobiota bacterium]
MKCASHIVALALVVLLVGGCGLKERRPIEGQDATAVETPDEKPDEALTDIDAGTEASEPLPMDTEFIEYDVAVANHAAPQRIDDRLTRTLRFTLTNTLDRLLTGQIVVDAPQGVSLVPGRTIGWRLRASRTAEIPVQVSITDGAPLGTVTLPVTIMVLGQEYRRFRLDVVKWLDVRVIGPFPPDEPSDASAPYPPEKKVDLERGAEWRGQEYEWREVPRDALHPDGMIDFAEIYDEQADGTAYAVLNVYAEAAVGVVVAFACDSPSTVWLNTRQMLDAPEPLAEESLVEMTLHKGANRLLVKCSKGDGGWAFILNVVGKQGQLPEGVKFDLGLRVELDRGDERQTVGETPGAAGETPGAANQNE